MMNRIESFVGEVEKGNVDSGKVGQAAEEHVSSMQGEQVKAHLETAAQNASQSGDTGVAQELRNLLDRHKGNLQELKTKAVEYIKQHPQAIRHFTPDFAQGLLGKLGL